MNAVPFAHEDQGDVLGDHGAAVRVDGDGVLKIGDCASFWRGEARERLRRMARTPIASRSSNCR